MAIRDLEHALAARYRAWEDRALADAAPVDERSAAEGVLRPLYTPLDVDPAEYLESVGFPGEFPYTRGIQPAMYRSRRWTMRQYAGYGSAVETNHRLRFLLERGQTGLSIAFDLPTQLGYDSDDPAAVAEVGQVGVAIDSVADMAALFDGIPLDRVSTSMTINAPAAVLLAMYVVVAERQGLPPSALSGTVQNDVLKEYVARGTYIFPPGPSLRLAADLIAYGAREMPRWNTISVSGYHLREAGCTAAQEMAFSIANAIAYLDACLRVGLSVDDFGRRASWIFNTHSNFLEEVAKYRALRRLWARLMRDRFGADDPRSSMLRVHTQTGGSTLTAQQPLNNVARAAIQALAAVLGGVQSLALSCYDEALGIPTEDAQQVALRTQQIIAFETGVAGTVDPLAGSYAVEALTNELEAEAKRLLDEIETIGGAVAAVESGYVQRQVQEAAITFQRAVEAGERVVVGVNRFAETVGGATRPTVFRPGRENAAEQCRRLAFLRERRDADAVARTLKALHDVATKEAAPLMPAILAAVRAEATLGEICGTLRTVFGAYTPPIVI